MTKEEQLIKVYENAYIRLIAIITRKIDRELSTTYEVSLTKAIEKEIRRLDGASYKYIKEEIPRLFNAVQLKELQMLNLPGQFDISLNTDIIKRLQDDLWQTLHTSNKDIEYNIKQKVNEIVSEQILQKQLGTSSDVAIVNSVNNLSASGITSFIDRAGRNWNMISYVDMNLRTKYTTVVNEAVISAADRVDSDLVIMSSHASSCPLCAVYEGRVYSISGNDKRFPKLTDAFPGGYSTIHPNCRHRLNVYVEDMQSDKELEKDIKNSNKPFEDTRTEEQKQLYFNGQQKKSIERQIDTARLKIASVSKLDNSEAKTVELNKLKYKLKALREKRNEL